MMNKSIKQQGITLIVLVITIIVLLILAGVSIALLTGESGILNKAQLASENTKKANTQEEIKIAIEAGKIQEKTNNNSINEAIENELKNKDLNAKVSGNSDVKIIEYNEKTYAANISNGDIRENVIPIYTADQLAKISTVCEENKSEKISIEQENGKEYEFTPDAAYIIRNDIDLSTVCYKVDGTPENDVSWKPIGNCYESFRGMIIGNGHEIKNLYINYNKNSNNLYYNSDGNGYALIGVVRGKVYISDLGVTGIVKSEFDKAVDIAGIVGTTGGTCEELSIVNCYNKADITSKVNQCSVGGVFGSGWSHSNVNITNSFNEGNISYNKGVNAGGIAGSARNINITNCYNKGNIIFEDEGNEYKNWAGGIIGGVLENTTEPKEISANIRNSYNLGEVTSYYCSGGIVGHSYQTSQIEKCYNIGKVTVSTDSESFVSGIEGACNLMVNIKKCYNKGQINSINNNTYSGGIYAWDKNYNIQNCYYLKGSALGGINKEDIVGQAEQLENSSMPSVINIVQNTTTTNMGISQVFKEDIKNINNGNPILYWQ